MSITTLTVDQMRDAILARKSVEDPTLDTSPKSDAWLDANAVAHLAVSILADVKEQGRNLLATTATGDALFDLARVWLPSYSPLPGETENELRVRLLAAMSGRPRGGSAADFAAWAAEVDGVSEAFVYPRWDDDPTGPPVVFGTVTVAPWGPSGARIVDASVVAAVQAHLDAVAPVGVVVTVEAVNEVGVAVTVYVRPKAGYEPDWSGTFTIASCPSPFSRVYLTTDPTTTICDGDRIVANVPPTTGYRERRVAHVGANFLDLTSPFPAAVTGTLYPGGPLWQPTWDAIEALFDGLGTYRSSDPTKPRYPAVLTRADSALRVSDCYAAIEAVEGVLSSRVTWPAADLDNAVAPGAAISVLRSTGATVILFE
jgi:hypothetical protein